MGSWSCQTDDQLPYDEMTWDEILWGSRHVLTTRMSNENIVSLHVWRNLWTEYNCHNLQDSQENLWMSKRAVLWMAEGHLPVSANTCPHYWGAEHPQSSKRVLRCPFEFLYYYRTVCKGNKCARCKQGSCKICWLIHVSWYVYWFWAHGARCDESLRLSLSWHWVCAGDYPNNFTRRLWRRTEMYNTYLQAYRMRLRRSVHTVFF